MRGDSPLAAEVLASTLCSGWYELAPDLSIHPHPLGPCPPLLMMRSLHDNLDAAPELLDVTLALARTFRSFDVLDPELGALHGAIEGELTARGVTAPAWSDQFASCSLVEARFVTALDGRTCRQVTVWQHACGERHAFDVVVDPWNFSDVVSIDVTIDVDDVLADLQRIEHLHRASRTAGVELLDPRSASSALARTIAKTFDHDLADLRTDQDSLSLFTLLTARSDHLIAATLACDGE